MHLITNRTLIMIFIALLGVFFLAGCASTGQNYDASSSDEMANIDELLGLGDSDSDTIGEDEVLEMLGIAEESAIQDEFEELGIDEQSGSGGLNSEVQQLESRQNQLDDQTRTLQNKIEEQENRIADMQYDTPKSQTRHPQSAFSQQYQEALQTYRSRQYRTAITKFETLLSQDSHNSLSDNAQYWIGESYYGLGNYQKAIMSFEKVFTFSNSNKDDAAQLKLGLCYMKLNDQAKAREELQKLINNYPSSESVGLARRLLNQISQ
ncbi:tetratricopeptide repeat protein [bacterium]|nr:tetratricopeptide repeat protein [bacterium]